jgi:hypothetical protein
MVVIYKDDILHFFLSGYLGILRCKCCNSGKQTYNVEYNLYNNDRLEKWTNKLYELYTIMKIIRIVIFPRQTGHLKRTVS